MKRFGFLLLSLLFLFITIFPVPVSADDSLKIQVGIYENEPKIFTDEYGNPAGFWVDVIGQIASEENWQIEYVHGSWEECLSRLQAGEIDIMPDVAYSDERKLLYDFSNETVYVSWSSVYSRSNIEIQSILDLEGKNIAVLKESINYMGPEGVKTLTNAFSLNCTFTEVDSYLRIFELIDSGEVDAGVVSKDFGHLNEADYNIKKTSILLQPASLKFAFPKNSALTPLLIERVDYQVRNMKTDRNSILYQAMENWLGVKPEEKPVFPEWVKWVIIGFCGLVLVLLAGHHALRGQVRTRTRELTAEIDIRKQTEVRNINLNSMLKTLRNINQLIVREKDPDVLIQECCELLVADRGVLCAWILLIDENRKYVSAASAGGYEMQAFIEQLEKGNSPVCVTNILAHKDMFSACGGIIDGNDSCLVRNIYGAGQGLISRLEYDGKVYGVMSIYLPAEFSSDAEEQSLVRELAGDIAFALHNLEMEKDRKNAEERIEALAKFPEENPNPVMRISFDGRILYANKGAVPILEHWKTKTGEQIIGDCRALVDSAINENRVIETENEIQGRIYSCFITPITSSGYVNIYGIDITQRREAEALLKESEEKYRSLVVNNDDAVLLTAPDGRIFSANQAACRMFGCSEQEICELGRNGIMDVSDSRLAPMLEERRMTGKAQGELTFLRKDGTRFPGEITSVVFTDTKGNARTSMTIRDISERKRIEEALRESELQHRTLFETMAQGVVYQSASGEIIRANPASERILGLTVDQMMGRTSVDPRWRAIHEDGSDFPGDAHPAMIALKTGEPVRNVVMAVFHPIDNKYHWIIISATPLFNPGETKPYRVYTTFTDITERRVVEEKLNALSQHQETILSAVPDIIMEVDNNKTYTWANRAGFDFFGDDVIGKEASSYFLGEQETYRAVQSVFDGSEDTIYVESFQRRKDGEKRLLAWWCRALKDTRGHITGALSAATDVTERKRMEEKLADSEARYRRLFETAQDAILILDGDTGQILDANPFIKDLLGYSMKELLGKNLWEIGELKDTLASKISYQQLHETGYVRYEHLPLVTKDGRKVDVEVVANSYLVDHTRVIQCNIRDITERKLAEEALRVSELFSSSLLENSPNPINVINPDTSIRYVNPALKKLTGFTSEELIGTKAPYPFWDESTRDIYMKRLEVAIQQGVLAFERQFTRKNGEKFWVSITNTPVKSGDKLEYLLSTWTDITKRKQAEELYTTIARSSPIGVYIVQNGGFKFVNPEFQKMTGYDEQQLLNMKSDEIIHPDDRNLVRENAVAMLKGQRNEGYEFRVITPDGKIRWAMETITSITYLGNNASLGSCMDITERKMVEQSLRLSDTTLKSINEAVIAIDNDSRVTFWNKKSEELFGIRASEALGKEFQYLITIVDEYPGQNEVRKRTLFDKGYNREEQLYCTPKGDIWVDAHSHVIEDENGRYGWIILAADITDRRKMEAALKESEEKFSEVFFANPNPMSIVVPDTAVINDVNEAFTKTSGFTREECIGNTTFGLGLWTSEKDRIDFIKKLSGQEIVRNYETEMRIKSGEIRNVLLSTRMISIAGKQYAVISSDDITERKKMQEQLMVTDRLASVGELAAGIAHELNNPLTGVIGFSDLLMARNDIPADVMEDLTVINKEALRASQVARHLLTFARKHPDEKRPVNINEVIQLVLKLRAYEQKVNNIEVNLSLLDDIPAVMANDFQLQQVFINIIINAEHFMIEEHGKGRLDIKTEQLGNMVRISINDDGPGIAPENLKRIFDPFFTTKDVGKGTGLGLSICYGVITEHGGNIWAESEPGKGAAFIFELPVYSPDEMPQP